MTLRIILKLLNKVMLDYLKEHIPLLKLNFNFFTNSLINILSETNYILTMRS